MARPNVISVIVNAATTAAARGVEGSKRFIWILPISIRCELLVDCGEPEIAPSVSLTSPHAIRAVEGILGTRAPVSNREATSPYNRRANRPVRRRIRPRDWTDIPNAVAQVGSFWRHSSRAARACRLL